MRDLNQCSYCGFIDGFHADDCPQPPFEVKDLEKVERISRCLANIFWNEGFKFNWDTFTRHEKHGFLVAIESLIKPILTESTTPLLLEIKGYKETLDNQREQYESSLKFFGWNPKKETADMFLSGLNGEIETLNHQLSTSIELLVKANKTLMAITASGYAMCNKEKRHNGEAIRLANEADYLHKETLTLIETFLKENGRT